MHTSLSISQNFFINTSLLPQLLEKAGFTKKDTVIDIGAGQGILTYALAEIASNVIALEPDPKLYEQLKHSFSDRDNVTIVNKTIEQWELPKSDYHVFANIPFNSTSYIVKKLCSDEHFVSGILFVQREAAEKFAGAQLKAKSTLFSILFGLDHTFSIIRVFAPGDFSPRPKVAVVALSITKQESLLPASELPQFRDFAAYMFNNAMPTVATLKKLIQKKDIHELKGLAQKKPTQLKVEEIIELFHYFRQRNKLAATIGYYQKTLREQESLQRIHRTRTDPNWRKTPKMV